MWVFYSALVAIILAGRRITNQHFQMPAGDLVLATKFATLLICFPLLFLVQWPTSPYFYLLAALTSPISFYKDGKTYEISATLGAGPLSRIEPLAVPFVFLAWFAFDWSLLSTHMEHPFIFTGIIACLLTTVFFTTRLRTCPINRQAFKELVPVIIASGALNLLAKGCTENMTSDSSILIYIFIQSFFALIYACFHQGRKRTKDILRFKDPRFTKVIIGLALSLIVVIFLRLMAFAGTSNPAYASSLMLTAPFWVLLFNRILKHKEEGNIANGIGIVCAAIGLALLTNL